MSGNREKSMHSPGSFASRCKSICKPGQPRPELGPEEIGVDYDGTVYIYAEIEESERPAFVNWAIDTWSDMHSTNAEIIEREAWLHGQTLYLD